MSFRNSSAPPPPPQPLFNQETLRQRLQALIKGARESWTYAIFWQSSYDYSGKFVLSWGDGYCKGDEDKGWGKSKVNSSATEQDFGKKVLRKLNSLMLGTAPSADDEKVIDTEWFFQVSRPQSFVNGSGLPGQAFFNSSPVWVAGADSLASSSCDRARQGQIFGLQTIVCIPSENGVIELGSTEVIFQSYDLMKRVGVLFNFSNMEAGSRPLDQGENDPSSFWISEPSRAVEVKDSPNPRANTNQQTAFNKRLSNEKCSETASRTRKKVQNASSRTDGAKAFDNAIGEGGFLTMAVNSSVEAHARGEKTINVAGSSLNDATAESTRAERALSRMVEALALVVHGASKSGPNDGLANSAALQIQKKSRDNEKWNQIDEALNIDKLLHDIEEVTVEACKIHRLPGAQVWVTCHKQIPTYGCRLPDENQNHCHPVAPIVPNNFPLEHPIFGFSRACREHGHLIKGEGVVGKAFASNQPWFSTDISSTPKTDYPLSEYARMFGIRSAVAVPLHIITQYNSTMDYVYEFFFPFNCTDHEEQMKTLTALISTLQRGVEKIRKTKSYPEFQLVLDPVNRVDYSLAYIESSSFPEESLRGPPSDRRLLPEPSYQSNKWLDQTPSIEPDEVFEDAVGQGSFLSMAVNETSHGTGEKTSLKDATVKGTGGKSNKRDWAWEYCYPIEGNSNGVICKFCKLEIKGGGITRFKSHINPLDPCKNVKKCENMSPEDKVKVAKGMKGGYNKRK